MNNTFTYKHSELPALRPEIKAQIVGLDVQIADLILKSQGNYRELEELAEVLGDALNGCELNLNSIRIIADDSEQPATVTMRDLPIEQKQLIYSCSNTNSILLNLLGEITGQPPDKLAHDIAVQASIHQQPVEEEKIEQFIENVMMPLAEKAKGKKQPKCHYVFKELN
ncbi:hypothetical protein QT979_08520 [Microcoleus sp. w2-18bC1]|uniref:hypothetical protein n=1 Tax=unclassified Microcoleus TaxID=2642155 RepID=UPI002FD48DF7